MKPQEVIGVAELAAYDSVIDVRSPGEFAEDHIPGAINRPVLDDAERARVGTLYAQESPFLARKVGAALVARNVAAHLEESFSGQPRGWRPAVYCWRGGNRSAAMAHILRQVGWPAAQLDGGYRTWRRHVIAALEVLPTGLKWRVICGPTGSGKSHLLQALAGVGAQTLDLEALAAHRGSVLGDLPGCPQPGQKLFESRLYQALSALDPALPVFVEAESRRIGALRLPEALMQAMRASPCVVMDLPLPARVSALLQDYAHFLRDPRQLPPLLARLVPLHGRERIARWEALADLGQWAALVAELLETHYDPAYRRSTGRNYPGLAEARVVAAEALNGESLARMAATVVGSFPPPATGKPIPPASLIR